MKEDPPLTLQVTVGHRRVSYYKSVENGLLPSAKIFSGLRIIIDLLGSLHFVDSFAEWLPLSLPVTTFKAL